MPTDRAETHFGFRAVPLDDKQRLVDDVFHSVARRYDLMNDLMSGGMHRLWKDALVSKLRPPPRGGRGWRLLDVAGGTGDIALRALGASRGEMLATVADINPDMLVVGRERAGSGPFAGRIEFVEANTETLPFPDRRFDAVTIAFGIRNVPRVETALAEMLRVLKLGGRFLCLEFSQVDIPALAELYDAYSFRVIPQLGRAVTGDAESYRYLVESIRRFPSREAFAGMMRKAGFDRVEAMPLSGGIVAIHSGWRL
jgi:demethylmenaquinone methyltransferase / 2-methoxy-6-polyprenyl-1,4-benzoquinol methylase